MRSYVRLVVDRWRISLPIAVASIAALAWLVFGFFGVHLIFIDDEVDEAAPVFDSGAGEPDIIDTNGVLSPELEVAIDKAMATDDTPMVVEVSDEMPMKSAPEILTVLSGNFVGHAHDTDGEVVVLTDGTEQRFLRFKNFATTNGPDLNVYLVNGSADGDRGTYTDDFIDLGDLKGNIGPQNYEIPSDVDLSIYDTVVIWCVRFNVSFGAADLRAG